ncbi:MAG: imidazole glycerol phosphate synthase subunit HisF [Rhodothermaceae bacterium]|nr:imidazole glycerol phosphate synthase subunit HisF [Rhodothermaceae bacterium]
MLAKRIIPCLDVSDGRTVKGVNFVGLRDAGDPVELAAQYAAEGADELVFLDITATVEKRQTVTALALRVGRVLDIPFTIGGGIGSVGDAASVLQAGADKVAVNSAAVARPELVSELAEAFGSQAIVVSVDAKGHADGWTVATHGGRTDTGFDALAWIAEVQDRGAGEILLTSMDADGTQAGFDRPLLEAVRPLCCVPLIASGGAGTIAHFAEVLAADLADAALAASLFHYGTLCIPDLKAALAAQAIPIRPC